MPDEYFHPLENHSEDTELDEVYRLLDKAEDGLKRARVIANGLYGLLSDIFDRPGLSDAMRDLIANDPRAVDAGNYLQPKHRLEWPKF